MSIISVSISELVIDQRLQMRETLNYVVIDDYAEHLFDLPPAKVVMGEGGVMWLWDGLHRYHAHKKSGQTNMKCEVKEGTFLDALKSAAGANHGHGIQRTDADKRRAVKALLSEALWQQRSDRMIAEACHVGTHLVAKVRADLTQPVVTESEPSKKCEPANEEKPGARAHTSPTRTDSRGRQQPASKKKEKNLCPACQHRKDLGRPLVPDCEACVAANSKPKLCERCKSLDDPIEGCTGCQFIRDNPGKKVPVEPSCLLDDAGTVVPVQLVGVFKSVALFDQFARQLNACAATAKEIEASPAKVAKPLDKNQPYQKFFSVFKQARERMKAMRPSLVCQGCGGDGCAKCSETGFLTTEMAKAMGASV